MLFRSNDTATTEIYTLSLHDALPILLVTDYASGYDTLTDAQATALMTEHLAIQRDVVKVKEKYRARFEKAIPAKLVLRFYQIENRLDTIIQVEALSAIPLAK